MGRREARASTSIDAPLETVWRALTDFSRYGEWNPFLVSVQPLGPIEVGQDVLLSVKWDSGGGAEAIDRFTAIRPPSPTDRTAALDWKYVGKLGSFGLLTMERCQRLFAVDEGVRYETWEQGSGPLSAFVPFQRIEVGFERNAVALKSLCERERRRGAG